MVPVLAPPNSTIVFSAIRYQEYTDQIVEKCPNCTEIPKLWRIYGPNCVFGLDRVEKPFSRLSDVRQGCVSSDILCWSGFVALPGKVRPMVAHRRLEVWGVRLDVLQRSRFRWSAAFEIVIRGGLAGQVAARRESSIADTPT